MKLTTSRRCKARKVVAYGLAALRSGPTPVLQTPGRIYLLSYLHSSLRKGQCLRAFDSRTYLLYICVLAQDKRAV